MTTSLTALNVLPAEKLFELKLSEESNDQLLDFLEAEVEIWEDTDSSFVAYKREELRQMLETEIPHEHWFTAPGLSSAKLIFTSTSGFELRLQTGTKQGADRLELANRKLREAGWQRNG